VTGPAGPADHSGDGPPGDRRSRLGDADRERFVAILREHYAAGRLDLEELRRRVGIVLGAAYADEAAAMLADLPPVGPPSPAAGPGSKGAAGRARRGRHGQAEAPAPGWIPTPERFRDPSTGTIMRVWTDPADGSRHYVPDN
jgi:hypothetical protein